MPMLPNNVIPFDLFKTFTTVVNWGDTTNAKLLTQLLTSVLGLNTVPMSAIRPARRHRGRQCARPRHRRRPLHHLSRPQRSHRQCALPTSASSSIRTSTATLSSTTTARLFHSLQADYVATTDGTVMYYIQPPSTYDQSTFSLLGDYDLFGHPGDEWRYYLVSGISSNMTGESSFSGVRTVRSSSGASSYTGFTLADSAAHRQGRQQVQGYVLVQGILQWPNLNTNAELFSDVLIYKAMSLLDTFPIGDPDILMSFLTAQYPNAPFVTNAEINLVFAKNIVSFFNSAQQALLPQ